VDTRVDELTKSVIYYKQAEFDSESILKSNLKLKIKLVLWHSQDTPCMLIVYYKHTNSILLAYYPSTCSILRLRTFTRLKKIFKNKKNYAWLKIRVCMTK
jgi:hypothetical protein